MNCEAIAPSTIVHSAPEVNDDDSQTDNNAQATDNMAEVELSMAKLWVS